MFSKRKSGEIILTSFIEAHSHAVTEEMYRRDTGKITTEDHELIKTLMAGNCKPQQIRRRLKEEQDTRVTVKAVRRAIKMLGGKKDNLKKFNKYLDFLKTTGSSIEYAVFPSGKVRYLTIATQKMKRAYLGADPSVIQCDTTFNFESSGRNKNNTFVNWLYIVQINLQYRLIITLNDLIVKWYISNNLYCLST